MAKDISKRTLVVLLIIVVLISITGTWTALNMEPTKVIQGPLKDTSTSEVKLRVGYEPPVPNVDSDGGEVRFIILK